MSRRRFLGATGEPRSLSESLQELTAGFGSRGRAIDVSDRWAAAVGEAIALHARPERLDAGRLTVVVDDPAWATEVRYHTPRILEALNAVNADSIAGTISALHVRVQLDM